MSGKALPWWPRLNLMPSLKAPALNTVTLRVKASIWEFGDRLQFTVFTSGILLMAIPWGCCCFLNYSLLLWFSHCVWLFWIPWIVAHQAPLSMEFSRQEYCSGLPVLPPGDLSNPGVEPTSPALASRSFTAEPPGKPTLQYNNISLFKWIHSVSFEKWI